LKKAYNCNVSAYNTVKINVVAISIIKEVSVNLKIFIFREGCI